MCAMMPMLRSLARAASAAATVIPTSRVVVERSLPAVVGEGLPLPAVMGEGLVRFGHLVGVLAPLDRRAEAVARVEKLVHESLDHGLLAPGPGVRDEPAQPQRGLPRGADLDRHLVGRATNTAAADLEGRLHVVHRPLERDHGIGTRLLLATLESAVDDALREGALAAQQDLVHQLGDER